MDTWYSRKEVAIAVVEHQATLLPNIRLTESAGRLVLESLPSALYLNERGRKWN